MFPLASALTLQNIPPAAAHLCLSVENFVHKELGYSLRHKKLLIGLSGGIDSTALLLIFHLLAPRNTLTLSAAHLNHGIRPEAGRDQEFCRHLCAHLSIPFFTAHIDVPAMCVNGKGLEDTARKARYAFFSSLKPSSPFDYLLTGHHLNDLAEDCFMRLLRGTGWPSLAGMPAYTPQRSQLRPLLMQSKEHLEEFLLKLNIPHVVDATNADSFTLRNKVRHHILPFFLKENPRFLERIASLWKQARMEEEDIQQLLAPIKETTAHALGAAGKILVSAETTTSVDSQHPLSQHVSSLDAKQDLPPRNRPLPLSNPTSPAPQTHPAPLAVVVTLSQEQLTKLTKSMRLRAYKHVLDALGPGQVLSETLLNLDKAWMRKKGKALFQFSHGKTAQIDKQSIVFKIN